MLEVLAHFCVLDDPRAANARHELSEIMFIAIAATLAGAKTCVEMVEFGEAKEALLSRVLELRHGIPSHDTFSTVFRTLDPAAFAEIFGTFATAFGTAIAKGAVITGDALHCNRRMAQTIVDGGADYVLPIKGNQDSLLSDARAKMGAAKRPSTARTEDDDHGRIETRRAVVVAAGTLGEHHEFPGLKAIGMIGSTRAIDGQTQTFMHYFALSRRFKPAELLRIKREHWGIENRLHWQLDVVLDEDMSRTRKDHSPNSLAMLRRLALDIARADKRKGSLAGNLRKAAWNDDALIDMLSQMP